MKTLTTLESDVLDLIPIGIGRKISIREIGQLLNMDERSIYEVVNSLRKKGVPVCAKRNGEPNDRGYYIATNEAERAEGIAAYKSQVHEMQSLIDQIEGADVDHWRDNLKGA